MENKTESQSIRVKNIVTVITFSLLLVGIFLALLIREEQTVSNAERRPLAEFPKLSYDEIAQGDFFDDFEEYALDQFIFRDAWRSIKAVSSLYFLGKFDNNGLYLYDGVIYKIEEMRPNSFVKAGEKIQALSEKYAGMNLYYSVIPDKNTLISDLSKRPSIDMSLAKEILEEKITSADYIDLSGLLSYEDYYATDLHWKQEAILDVADRLLASMGNNYIASHDSFSQNKLYDFQGSYYGQAALPAKSDVLTYLTNETLANVTVTHFATKENGTTAWEEIALYSEENFQHVDPYDLFVGGPETLVRIENPDAGTDKKLYLFRDSFGSSLSPLLVGGYSEIILIDLRYVSSDYLDYFIEFEEGNDMLFLYSTHILNESSMLR